ncbi:MAG: fused MFS/spermidine synthase, partial [Planctomycetota bacterium]
SDSGLLQHAPANPSEAPATSAPTAGRRLWWILLTFMPSSLLLGVTTHITTDLAPVPLLWVIPLALYLLTFVLVFARKAPIPHAWMLRLFPFVIVAAGIVTVQESLIPDWMLIPLHLLAFFAAGMVCHGELVASRPAAKHLTGFYLCISLGGVLGGLFNAVIAPLAFNTLVEYPLMMVLACLTLSRHLPGVRKAMDRYLDFALPVALGLATAGILLGVQKIGATPSAAVLAVTVGLPAAGCLALRKRAVRFALGLGAVLLSSAYCFGRSHGTRLYVERNFYGVKYVIESRSGNVRLFRHGSTTHGIQATHPALSREPLAYFHRRGPVGDVFRALSGRHGKSRIAVVGLGVGSMACYAKPGQHFTFYEIDPQVEQIARNPEFFTFLDQCRGSYEVILGDGRLTLGQAPDSHYGIIVLDAFSSDAIPTHLLSREALQLYLSKLEDGGILVFHISNRYVDLQPLLASLAAEEHLACVARDDLDISPEEIETGRLGSRYVVMGRRPEDVAGLAALPNWQPVPLQPGVPVWTDQFSNILSVLWRS